MALHLAPPMSSLRFWPTSYDMAGLERFEQSSESESPATKCEAAAAPKDGALLAASHFIDRRTSGTWPGELVANLPLG